MSKDNQAPYPVNPNVPMPRSTDVRQITPGQPDTSAYLVQNGPYATDLTYTRILGGTTMHWEAKTPRMLPEDFHMASQYGQGLDWPLGYDDIEPFYREAEREIGVSADVADQSFLGLSYPPGYVFPMRGLPPSYLDQVVGRGINGTGVELSGERFTLQVRLFPQGRNGIPNPEYDGGRGYTPVGAVSTHQAEAGGRCRATTTACRSARSRPSTTRARPWPRPVGNGVDLLAQAVAYQVDTDPVNGRVTHIEFRAYRDPSRRGTSRGRRAGGSSCSPPARSRTPGSCWPPGCTSAERAHRPQPDGPRVPAQLGAAARGRGHRPRVLTAPAASSTCAAARSAAGRPASPSTSTTTAGAGRPARRSAICCTSWTPGTSSAPTCAAP